MRHTLLFFVFLFSSGLSAQTFWAQQQAGGNVDETLAAASDQSGNSYLTGYFSTSATINGELESVSGLTDIFISKTNLSGASAWVKSYGGSGSDRGLDIAVDGSGNVYVCGFFKNTINFGGGITISSEANSQDGFVAKFNSSGDAVWAKSCGSTGQSDQANGVAVDNSGNVIITGQFSGDANFGPNAISSLGGSIDVFIAKYNSSGDEQWVKKGSGDTTDKGVAVSTDGQGNIYAIGQFNGDIQFDNSYSNTIQNALFLVKYNGSGSEQWFRWAGGSDQSIANDVVVDGTSVYLTGDFGSEITFLGGAAPVALSSGYSSAVFLVSYNTSGSYAWGESQGSTSSVSARGLDVKNGQIGVCGWYECTFESLSAEYGDVTFNSIGFKDAYIMRYSTSGSFDWARNFGSKSDEMAYDVALLSDGYEVVVGVFSNHIIVPRGPGSIPGMGNPGPAPNSGLTYCGDPNYGDFAIMNGEGDQDGFAIKVFDLDRSPYDFYQHYGSGCDLTIPEMCIQLAANGMTDDCPESIIGCAPYYISAVNQVMDQALVGYSYNVQWSPFASGNYLVDSPGTVTATLTSQDGCYTNTATIDVDIYPETAEPLISDDEGVNDMAIVPFPIFLCPGEDVVLTGHFDPGLEHSWSGPGISGSVSSESVTVSDEGWYQFNVVNEFGCIESNFVQVQFIPVPEILIAPEINFNAINDTVNLCGGATGFANVFDEAYEGPVPNVGFEWDWDVEEPGSGSSTSSSISFGLNGDGWYTVSVSIEMEDNECIDDLEEYTLTDSVYIVINPVPSVFIELTGPTHVCPNDTFMLYIDYDGDLELNFDFVEDFGDSILVTGDGIYSATVSALNEFECSATSGDVVSVQSVSTPQINSNSATGVICPGDSILLSTNTPGNVIWQGPDGTFETDTSQVYVYEAGQYYIEVNYYAGCELVSNTIEVSEYTTPYLSGSNAVLCEGESVEISVISSGNSSVLWLDPLSGNDSIQVITEPGIYGAEITGCGITTTVSIEVLLNDLELEIIQPDMTPVCEGDSILIEATDGYSNYIWTPDGTDPSEYFYDDATIQVSATDFNNCLLESNEIQISFEEIPGLPIFDFEPVCLGDTQVVNVESTLNIWYTDGVGGDVLQQGGLVTIPNFISDTTLFVYISSEFCDGPPAEVTIGPKPFPDAPIISTDAPVCTGTQLTLTVLNSDGVSSYNWYSPSQYHKIGDEVNYSIQDITDSGIYTCYADLSDCRSDTVSILVDIFITEQVVLPPDTALCEQADFVLIPEGDFDDLIWSDGSSDSTYIPYESGVITLLAHDSNGCQSFDDFYIELVDCDFDIPNIFSPNGDGYNDNWSFAIHQARFFEIDVYNRWGTIVFESSDSQVMWDGRNYKSDELCSEGVYYYILHAITFDGRDIKDAGDLTIVRE